MAYLISAAQCWIIIFVRPSNVVWMKMLPSRLDPWTELIWCSHLCPEKFHDQRREGIRVRKSDEIFSTGPPHPPTLTRPGGCRPARCASKHRASGHNQIWWHRGFRTTVRKDRDFCRDKFTFLLLLVTAVWPDLTKFHHFGKILTVFGTF